MSVIPHKEERFLFVVYPHICFAAAVAMYYILGLLRSISTSLLRVSKVSPLKTSHPLTFLKNKTELLGSLFTTIVVVAVVVLSISRTSSIVVNYRAPIKLFGELYEKELSENISEQHFPGVDQGKNIYYSMYIIRMS